MAATPVNLRGRFGRRYKVTHEEAYRHEYGPRARVDDPWLQIIPGQRGHVFPWDDRRLAASTNTSGATATKLKALPLVEVWQDGADGATVLFPADKLDEVADLLKLRRRRYISEQERERLAGLGRRYRFQPRGDGFQSDSGALGATIGPKVDPGSRPTPKAAVRPSEMNRVPQ